MRDVDVMHGDPEQIGRFLFHQAFRNIDGKLIRAGDSSCVRLEIIDGELQDILHLLQFEFTAADLRRVERRLVVVAQQMVVIGTCSGGCCTQ